MAIEIEIKAWVSDPPALRSRLDALGERTGPYEKDDEYWKPSDGRGPELGSGVRIRRTGAGPSATVNFKRKEVRDGMEVNDEREFDVTDATVLAELLARLGLSPWIRKRKVGEAWDVEGITAELSLVEGLGTFVELEILAADNDAETVAAGRVRLYGLLDRLGVPRDRVEGRYYTQMLAEKRKE